MEYSAELFQAVLDTIAEGIIVIDTNGTIVMLNSELCRIFGYEQGDLIGKPLVCLFPESIRPGFELGMQQYISIEVGHVPERTLDVEGLKQDRTLFPAELRIREKVLTNQRLFIVAVRDITARKARETKLQEAIQTHQRMEEQLTLLVDAARHLLGSLNLEIALPSIVALSRRLIAADAYAVWRYIPTLNEWRIVVAEGLSETYKIAAARLLSSSPPFDGPIVADDIEQNDRLSNRRPVYQQEGIRALLVTPLHIRGQNSGSISFYYRQPHQFSSLDVRIATALANIAASAIDNAELHEERKQTEQALRLSELRFRRLVEQSPLSIQVLDPSGHTLLVNHAWTAISGATLEQISAYNILQDPQLVEKGIMPYIQRGFAGEVCEIPPILYDVSQPLPGVSTQEQPQRWLRAYIYPVKDEAGHIREVVLIHQDITDQKQNEEEIQKLNAELERRVLERTHELEASNHELEAFSYSVSHDLRAPLRAISGFANMLTEEYSAQLPAEGQRYMEMIRESARHMGQLIDDLLSFSRLNRELLNKQQVDLAAMARELLSEMLEQQPGRKIEVNIADLPMCNADPFLLRQVWINLLSNALKFTRERDTAHIDVGFLQRNGETIYYVKDNGVGFDMRYADKLFVVFQRLHRAEDFEGTGVGLALVQRIIRRHGGRIWADAAVDAGATFYFTLEPPVS